MACSMAAARNVSPAASMTEWPELLNFAASLPMVVVLPEPFTPTTRMVKGCLPASMAIGLATADRTLSISLASTALTSPGSMPFS